MFCEKGKSVSVSLTLSLSEYSKKTTRQITFFTVQNSVTMTMMSDLIKNVLSDIYVNLSVYRYSKKYL